MIDVERSHPAPRSLEREASYKDADVLQALFEDFLSKCYLCERQVILGEFHVDHRRPQAEWPQGRYDWANLFPACSYCNQRRPKRFPEVGLVSPGEGVERRIRQVGRVGEKLEFECDFAAVNPEDEPALATAKELTWIHSVETGKNDATRLAARGLLDAIHDHFMKVVHPLETRVRRARHRDEVDREAEGKLREVLSRRAPFTMLMRSLVDPSLRVLFD